MNYLLLINQGSTPTPGDPQAWASLSEEEQEAVVVGYQAISQTPGVTRASGCRPRRWPRRCGCTTARRSPPTARTWR
jgi:hypothetical protein